MQTTITSKSQVAIPQVMRQHFGLMQDMAVTFAIEGDHRGLCQAPSTRRSAATGFGLINNWRETEPSYFDVARFVVNGAP